MGDHVTKCGAGGRDHDTWGEFTESSPGFDCALEVPRQERWDLRCDLVEGFRGCRWVLGANHAINKPDREVEAVWVREHAGELLGRLIDGVIAGCGEPVTNLLYGFVCEVPRADESFHVWPVPSDGPAGD